MAGSLLIAVVLSALCPAVPAYAEDLLLDPGSSHVLTATINGVALRLRVALDAHGYLALNKAAARRAKLGRGDGRSTMAIGPVRLKGRTARRPVTIGGTTEPMRINWYEAAVDTEADGVISPGALPYDRVRLRFASFASGERERVFQVRFSDDDGLHVPVRVPETQGIAVRLSPTSPYTVATGAAGAVLAQAYGGTLSAEVTPISIGYDVQRPARRLSLATPVRVGSATVQRLMMRSSDFLGGHPLPHDALGPGGDIVVTGAAERQKAVYRITLGSDVLGTCGEAEYRRAERSVVLRCR